MLFAQQIAERLQRNLLGEHREDWFMLLLARVKGFPFAFVKQTGDIKKIDDNAVNRHDTDPAPQGLFAKLGVLVKKAINCCIE